MSRRCFGNVTFFRVRRCEGASFIRSRYGLGASSWFSAVLGFLLINYFCYYWLTSAWLSSLAFFPSWWREWSWARSRQFSVVVTCISIGRISACWWSIFIFMRWSWRVSWFIRRLFLITQRFCHTLSWRFINFAWSIKVGCRVCQVRRWTMRRIGVTLRYRSTFCTRLRACPVSVIMPCSYPSVLRTSSCTTTSHLSVQCSWSSAHSATSLTKSPRHLISYRPICPSQSPWPGALYNKDRDCFLFMSFLVTRFLWALLLFARFGLRALRFTHSFWAGLCALMSFLRFWFSSSRFRLFCSLMMKGCQDSFAMHSFFGFTL